jgi:hypothetical protein
MDGIDKHLSSHFFHLSLLTPSQKVAIIVTPAKAVVQNLLKILDSVFRRNDKERQYFTFCGTVIYLSKGGYIASSYANNFHRIVLETDNSGLPSRTEAPIDNQIDTVTESLTNEVRIVQGFSVFRLDAGTDNRLSKFLY